MNSKSQDEQIAEIAATPVKMVSVVEIDNGFIVAVGKHQFSVTDLYSAKEMMIKLFDQQTEYGFGRNESKESEKTAEELEVEQEKIDSEDLDVIENKIDELETKVDAEIARQEAESLQENNNTESAAE